jgi:hypothetical protein
MKPAVFDFEDIHRRLAVMQGNESSGVRYEPLPDDGSAPVKVAREHSWDHVGHCQHCSFTLIDVEDGLAPKECSWKKLAVATRLTTLVRGQKRPIEIWRHHDGSTFEYFPSGSLQHLQLFRKWKVEGKKATNEERFGLSNILDGMNKALGQVAVAEAAYHAAGCLCLQCVMNAEHPRWKAYEAARKAYEAQVGRAGAPPMFPPTAPHRADPFLPSGNVDAALREAFARAAKAGAEVEINQTWPRRQFWVGLDTAKVEDKDAAAVVPGSGTDAIPYTTNTFATKSALPPTDRYAQGPISPVRRGYAEWVRGEPEPFSGAFDIIEREWNACFMTIGRDEL